MFLRSCKNEDGIGRRFFQCFQEGIESLGRQHMNLIDDIHLVFTHLRRDSYLVDQMTDILHRIITRGIQFKDIEGVILVWIAPILGVNHFGQNPSASCLSNAPRTRKQKGLSQFIVVDFMHQRLSHLVLTDHIFERGWTILSSRNNKLIHYCKVTPIKPCCQTS